MAKSSSDVAAPKQAKVFRRREVPSSSAPGVTSYAVIANESANESTNDPLPPIRPADAPAKLHRRIRPARPTEAGHTDRSGGRGGRSIPGRASPPRESDSDPRARNRIQRTPVEGAKAAAEAAMAAMQTVLIIFRYPMQFSYKTRHAMKGGLRPGDT